MTDLDKASTLEDDTGNSPRYASLTAGLLARKGEAVPAAAAFTAEAIAQHIPARRLAQEAERILTQPQAPMPELESQRYIEDRELPSGFAAEHERIEDAFLDDLDDLDDDDFEDERRDVYAALTEAGRRPLDLPQASEIPPAPSVPPVPQAPSVAIDAAPLGRSINRNEEGPLSEEEEDEQNVAPIPGLDESKDNWFEDIVTRAIQDVDSPQISGRAAPEEAELYNRDPRDHAVTRLFAEPSRQTATAAQIAQSSRAGNCDDRVAEVRNAIRSGNPRVARQSAMRLDPRRFIRLSLASKKLDLSNQELMMAALDAYLDTLDEEVFSDCSCMKKGLI